MSGTFTVTTDDQYSALPFAGSQSFRINNLTNKLVAIRKRHEVITIENFEQLNAEEWTGNVETGWLSDSSEGRTGGLINGFSAYRPLFDEVNVPSLSEVHVDVVIPNEQPSYSIKIDILDSVTRINMDQAASSALLDETNAKPGTHRIIFVLDQAAGKSESYIVRGEERELLGSFDDAVFGSTMAESIIRFDSIAPTSTGYLPFSVDNIVYRKKANYGPEQIYPITTFTYTCDSNINEYEVASLGSEVNNFNDASDQITLTGFYE